MNNPIKQKLINGEQTLGAFIGIYSPSIVEMLGYAGFEFIVIDDEHGTFNHSELENMIRAAECVGMVPFVRVSYDSSSIQKALDRGAKGIHVPMVNTKEDAEQIIRKAKFPPVGQRGAAFSTRAARFGKETGEKYLNDSDRDTLIVVHIETQEAVDNFEDIMSVEGIDVAFLGPTDLSVNLGFPNEGANHPEIQRIANDLYQKGKNMGIPIGTIAPNADVARNEFNKGANYIGVVATAVISNSFSKVVGDVRETNLSK
ncbi:aldolase/citrate lyase family protein [Alkalihalobacillus sp. MEB130]|uniref:HpcH/HpaI aldolase family protein n=1 Tax=Alkalihalobacillus sp. MEB130 TaxID=2976704 RepID=UPI0028DDDA1E|nr:aldolase/citrate lyase family protein [Alkalihalobacillus sp. MEB130]MDT8862149.1 aldolase/citrate lyase family protein [Alkalihalobacillus sp. MEB130]